MSNVRAQQVHRSAAMQRNRLVLCTHTAETVGAMPRALRLWRWNADQRQQRKPEASSLYRDWTLPRSHRPWSSVSTRLVQVSMSYRAFAKIAP